MGEIGFDDFDFPEAILSLTILKSDGFSILAISPLFKKAILHVFLSVSEC